MKKYKEIYESRKEREIFNIFLYDNCEYCSSEPLQVDCDNCQGSGVVSVWEYDDSIGSEVDFEDVCSECDGDGQVDMECLDCDDKIVNYTIQYIKGEGVYLIINESNGESDDPIQYDDGRVAYNNPGRLSTDIKDIIELIFNNKDLSHKEIINLLVQHIYDPSNDVDVKMDISKHEDMFTNKNKVLIKTNKQGIKFNL